MGVIFVPIYLRYIGVEAYGLVGIFMSLQAFLNLLDFGISPTFNRELARLSVSDENAQEMHDLRKTLQVPNWLSALAILVITCALSPVIANLWVQPKDLTIPTITHAFLLMSCAISVQFLSAFNAGGLVGLQQQVLLNSINIVAGTLRSVGAWVLLAYVSPTIEAFLWWQLLIAVLQWAATSIAFRKSMAPAPRSGRFRKDLLHRLWRFAAGMTGTGFLALLVTQSDKVVLSRMLSLEDFGYYALAITISAMAIGMVVNSISGVVYPRLAMLISKGDEGVLTDFYHRSSQLLAFFLVPLVIVLAVFSYQVVLIWARNPTVADHTYILLSLVVIGGGLNGLAAMPHSLQTAYGWTRLGIYLLLGALPLLLPAMILGVYTYGTVGAIGVWIGYNIVVGFISVWATHRRLLKGEGWKWFSRDVLPPVVASLVTDWILYYFFADWLLGLRWSGQLGALCLISVITLAVSGLSLSSGRQVFMKRVLHYGS